MRAGGFGRRAWAVGLVGLVLLTRPGPAQADAPARCEVRAEGDRITLAWPSAPGESGRVVVNLDATRPLLDRVELVAGDPATGRTTTLLRGVDPAAFVSVGSRANPPPTPPGMSVFNVFFDNPARRPYRTYRVDWLDGPKRARSENREARASVAVGPVGAGPFRGEWVVTVYAGSRLVHLEAVLRTDEDARAFTYDLGVVAPPLPTQEGKAPEPIGREWAWLDPLGHWQRRDIAAGAADRSHAVRHRAIFLEAGQGGTVACFPPPHQFFFPRDFTDNLATTWTGADHRGLAPGAPGFGVRQPETGGGNYAPWFNAPPGTDQRLGAFLLLHPGPAEAALAEVLRFTHGDRFPSLPGFRTFSSHYHIAFTVEAMRQKAQGIDPPAVPPLVGVFQGLGVDAVHVAEFHGDGHPDDPGPLRLPEIDAMFAECRRLSGDRLLVIPGEEANLDLGHGPRSGHWLEMFPHPVRFTMRRAEGQPLRGDDGIYRLRDAADVREVLRREHGLAWTAHPRIKASNFAPDISKDDPLFRDPAWLGAAWKAMPADLSRPRLGDRSLDLLDDMSQWGARKQLLGEVDTFKVAPDHEMYGHMNVNYLRLGRLPRFDEGWQPILDALRAGQFFVTTGEVLIPSATLAGRELGGNVDRVPTGAELRVELDWTFPLRFAEVVVGDGSTVRRDRLDLATTGAFGHRVLTLRPDLKSQRWVRFAAWDVAGNGAFTQPTWIGPGVAPAAPSPAEGKSTGGPSS